MSKISIVIPVYYNSDTLDLLYSDMKEKILDKFDDYELVFVDDGSGDNSWEIVNRLKENDTKIIAVRLSRNFGEHSAILAGLSVATGDCVVTKQADLQEESELILQLYERWKKGNKVVLAIREDRVDSLGTKIFAGIYYRLVQKFINKEMPKGGCDCYLLDKDVVKTILNMKNTNLSLTLQVLWVGYRPDKVYFHRKGREVGKGRWTLAKKIKLVLDSFFSFSYIPIRLMWIVGILFFIFSIIMGISVFVEAFTTGTPIAGWSSLMCVVLCSSGLSMLMFGMIGEYIWRTFESSLERPAYII